MAFALKGFGSGSAANSATANQASLVITTTTTAGASDDLAVVCYAVDNSATLDGDEGAVTAVTDSGGNTWFKAVEFTNGQGTAQTGATCGIWYSNLTAAIAIGGTITLTFHTAATRDASAANVTYWTKTAGTFAVVEAKNTLANDAAAAGSLNATTANIACLRIRAIASESTTATALTKTAAFTAVMPQAIASTTMAIRGEYLISTGTGQASAPTAGAGAVDNASVYVAFKEAATQGIVVEATRHINNSLASIVVPSLTTTKAPGQIVVFVGTQAASITNVTATGLTFTRRVLSGFSSWTSAAVYVAPYTSNFSGTITVTQPTATFATVDVMAVSGVSSVSGIGAPPFDANASLPGVNTSSNPTGTTTNANDIVFSFLGAAGTGNVAPVPWSLSGAGLDFHIIEYQIVQAAGSFTGATGTGGSGILDALVVGVAGISGTLATTEDDDVAAFTASVVVSGTLTTTEVTDDATFSGSVVVSGALAATEAADDATFFGSVVVSGALTTTEAIDVAAFTGSVISAITGTLATTEAIDVAAFAGSVVIAGTLITTEVIDVAAFAGKVGVSGTLTATEVNDVANFSGSFIASGTLTATEAKDVLAFIGSSTFDITGTLATIEVRDTATFSGGVVNATTGVLAANEAGISLSNNSFPENSAVNTVVGALVVGGIDVAAFSGLVTGVVGTLAVTEAQDQAFFQSSALASITGTLVANEAGIFLTNNSFPENAATNTVIGSLTVLGVDAAAFSGFVGIFGALESTEAADVAVFAGVVLPTITAVLAVTEAPDSAVFGGTVQDRILVQLTATEAIDSAAFNGALHSPPAGPFAAFEAPDIAAFNGSVTGIVARLVTVEISDLVNFNGSATQIPTIGDLIVIEPQDIAFFTGIAVQADDSDFVNWKFGRRFDRSLTSRFPWQESRL